MKLADALDNKTTKIKELGSNAVEWFGDLQFTASLASPLFLMPLPRTMTGQEIVDEYNITPVGLDDVYGQIAKIKKSSLFFVNDLQGTIRTIFVFKAFPEDVKYTIVARELNTDPWFGDMDIYSLNEITLK